MLLWLSSNNSCPEGTGPEVPWPTARVLMVMYSPLPPEVGCGSIECLPRYSPPPPPRLCRMQPVPESAVPPAAPSIQEMHQINPDTFWCLSLSFLCICWGYCRASHAALQAGPAWDSLTGCRAVHNQQRPPNGLPHPHGPGPRCHGDHPLCVPGAAGGVQPIR